MVNKDKTKCDCTTGSHLEYVSPEIAVAYRRLALARERLLSACSQDRQMEVARLQEDVWSSYEDDVFGRLAALTDALQILADTKSRTVHDLAIKFAAVMRNDYVTEKVRFSLDADLRSINRICPTCLEVNTINLIRSRVQ